MNRKDNSLEMPGRQTEPTVLPLEGSKQMMLRISIILFMCLVMTGTGLCERSAAYPLTQALMLAQLQAAPSVAEKPVAPEKNPPGDIPDSQVFITYTSVLGGYKLRVPEGWARTTLGTDVKFTQYFDGLAVELTDVLQRPTVASIRRGQAQQLKKTGRAVVIKSIKAIKVSHQPAVVMVYQSNSAPNPVTNKQVRLENETYFFYRPGKLAALSLWAPLGADNADQWKLIAHSFTWR